MFEDDQVATEVKRTGKVEIPKIAWALGIPEEQVFESLERLLAKGFEPAAA